MATSRGFLQFAARFGVIGSIVGLNSERIVRKAAITGLSTAVLATRVRFGRARANWSTGLGRPPQQSGSNKPDPSGARPINRGTSRIGQWKKSSGAIYVVNGVPYIQKLNNLDAMSTQALQAARKEFAKGKLLRGV